MAMKYSLCLKRAKPFSSWRNAASLKEENLRCRTKEDKEWSCVCRRDYNYEGPVSDDSLSISWDETGLKFPRTTSDVAPGKPQSCQLLGSFLLTSWISTVSLMDVSCSLSCQWLCLNALEQEILMIYYFQIAPKFPEF